MVCCLITSSPNFLIYDFDPLPKKKSIFLKIDFNDFEKNLCFVPFETPQVTLIILEYKIAKMLFVILNNLHINVSLEFKLYPCAKFHSNLFCGL